MLGESLLSELPLIMCKANNAYHTLVRTLGTKPLLAALPSPYFDNTSQRLRADMHTLYHFFENCKDIRFGPKKFVPLGIFKTHFHEYVQENNLPHAPWRESFYRAPFKGKKLTKEKAVVLWGGKMADREIVRGLTLVNVEGAPVSLPKKNPDMRKTDLKRSRSDYVAEGTLQFDYE